MTPSLQNELLFQYGELMQEFENSNDYFQKIKLESKMNAINELLDVPQVKLTSTISDFLSKNMLTDISCCICNSKLTNIENQESLTYDVSERICNSCHDNISKSNLNSQK